MSIPIEKVPPEQVRKTEAKARAAEAMIGSRLKQLQSEVMDAMGFDAPRRKRFYRIMAVANEADKLVKPFTPCGQRCSYCCSQAVTITAEEARAIEEATGQKRADIKPRTPEKLYRQILEDQKRFMGKRCPFLGESGECTVYGVRPIACRTHHSLNDDPAPCDTRDENGIVPAIDLGFIVGAATFLYLDEGVADIRDWFNPRKEGT